MPLLTEDDIKGGVQSWKDLVEALSFFEGKCVWACRGEAEEHEFCQPSIDRCTQRWRKTLGGLEHRVLLERVLMTRFADQAPPYLADYEREMLKTPFGTMMLMRHFGAPTRLLDWSGSLWIAAYFAAARAPNKCGQILFFDRYQLEANVSSQFGKELDVLDQFVEDRSGSLRPHPKLLDFEYMTTSPEIHPWMMTYYMHGTKFPRLSAQQGLFTVASFPFLDHWDMAWKLLPPGSSGEGAIKIVIQPDAKPAILQGLERMGITAATLYPGLDGLGMALSAFTEYSHLDIGMKQILGENWRTKH